MAETVILNESVAWNDDIRDSIGPDYGFPRRHPNTRISVKPPGGRPYTRETQNAGHSFQLSWLNRSYECVQKIEQFYNQYEDGYFTIIDHDGGGRHYVGRFTGPFEPTQKENDSWDIQGLLFEQVPGVPMLVYPTNWERDAINLRVANDWGDQNLSTSGTWTPGGTPAFATLNSTGTAGDFATMEYRGYGYKLWMQTGPAYGQVQVLLDNVVADTVDLYAAAAARPEIVSTNTRVPLDLHRLKVLVLGTKNAASTAAAASWCMLQVMR